MIGRTTMFSLDKMADRNARAASRSRTEGVCFCEAIVGEMASRASRADSTPMVSARPTMLDTFSAWTGMTAKSAMAIHAARGSIHRRAKAQAASTRPTYQSKDET